MRTPQLLFAVVVIAAATACNRPDADGNAQQAADQVRAVATKTGHQLADSWLTTKIQAQYFADDDIKARHINVSTRDGVVTLTGFVDGPKQRELAVQIARTTDGVRHVNDRLTTRGADGESGAAATTGTAESAPAAPAAAARSAANMDPLLTARVQSRFFVDEQVKGRRIDVETRDGVVVLSGEVADESERAQALRLARTTEGVVRVEDHLTVAPQEPGTSASAAIDDATLTTMIQAKYFVDTTVKESPIEVSVKDGVVLLGGTVTSEGARNQAVAIAHNTEGVVQVIDRITVGPVRP